MSWVLWCTQGLDPVELIRALRAGEEVPGAYLKVYDPDANKGQGLVVLTLNVREALRFASCSEAMACWAMPSTITPKRLDGKPNRPLTAFTVEPIEIKEDPA